MVNLIFGDFYGKKLFLVNIYCIFKTLGELLVFLSIDFYDIVVVEIKIEYIMDGVIVFHDGLQPKITILLVTLLCFDLEIKFILFIRDYYHVIFYYFR